MAQRFTTSFAKDRIRHTIDRDLIKKFRTEHYHDRQLAYLGLPGEELLDVLSWREFIGRCTAVENTDAMERLEFNVLRSHLEHMVDPLHGDIDELLVTNRGSGRLRWPYEIVNLDYTGGLVNAAAARGSKRLDALKGLFSHQIGTAFLLFLTLNLRDKDHGELDDLVKQQEDDLAGLGLNGVRDCFEAHRRLGHAGLLKIYVPIFLSAIARQHSLLFIRPILYQGTRQMIHFAVQCLPFNALGAGRVATTGERIDLINLELLTLHGQDDLREVNLGKIGGIG